MQFKTIPIAMICDKNFIMQTCVALTSMYLNKDADTIYEIYVILVESEGKEADSIKELSSDNFNIHILMMSLEKYRNIKQIAHVPLASLVKFDICDLISEYSKILYLDGDIIVRQDLWQIYSTELEDNYVAGVPHSLGIVTSEHKLNGGVLLFNAEKIRNEKLRDVFVSTRQSMGDRKSMDQETFHVVFGEKKKYLCPKYNVMVDKINYEKKYYSLREYNNYFKTDYHTYKEIINSAVIMHFTGAAKPWKYKFGNGTKEWLRYYRMTFPDNNTLPRRGRAFFIAEQVKQNGIRSLYWMLKDQILAFIGANLEIYIDKSYGKWN
ncbi:MAG: hypothetical protein HDR71_01940 [Lachnospiraceae bacterium]|nr:hypothetical protein [Lachnospiraceae bacterium]